MEAARSSETSLNIYETSYTKKTAIFIVITATISNFTRQSDLFSEAFSGFRMGHTSGDIGPGPHAIGQLSILVTIYFKWFPFEKFAALTE
jgi:hypothetical protein